MSKPALRCRFSDCGAAWCIVALILAFFIVPSPAGAAPAGPNTNCRDYTHATNRAFFQASVYDFVKQQTGDQPGDALNLATTKIVELVDTYCPEHPYENLAIAIAHFTAIVIHPPQVAKPAKPKKKPAKVHRKAK